MMLLSWTEEAWEDYLYWQTTNKQNVKRRRTCKIIVPADTAVAPLKKEAFF